MIIEVIRPLHIGDTNRGFLLLALQLPLPFIVVEVRVVELNLLQHVLTEVIRPSQKGVPSCGLLLLVIQLPLFFIDVEARVVELNLPAFCPSAPAFSHRRRD